MCCGEIRQIGRVHGRLDAVCRYELTPVSRVKTKIWRPNLSASLPGPDLLIGRNKICNNFSHALWQAEKIVSRQPLLMAAAAAAMTSAVLIVF